MSPPRPEPAPPADSAAASSERQVACPLCRCAVSCGAAAPGSTIVCQACSFSFPVPPLPPEPPANAKSSQEAAPPAWHDPLLQWLAGNPLEARRLTATELARDWLRRHPRRGAVVVTAAATAALLLVALLVTYGSVAAAWQWELACRQSAEQQLRQTEHTLQQTTQQQAELQQQKISGERQQSALQASLRQLQQEMERCRQERDLAMQRQAQALGVARAQLAGDLTREAQQLADRAPLAAILLAGQCAQLTTADGGAPSVAALQCLHNLAGNAGCQRLPVSESKVTALAFGLGKPLAAVGNAEGDIQLWQLGSTEPPQTLSGPRQQVSDLRLTGEGRWLVATSFDGSAYLWDLEADALQRRPLALKGHAGRVIASAVSASQRWLVTASSGFTPRENLAILWDLAAARPHQSGRALPGLEGQLHSIAISPSGQWIAAGFKEGGIVVWSCADDGDISAPRVLRPAGPAPVMCRFGSDDRWLIAAAAPAAEMPAGLELWSVPEGRPATLHGEAPNSQVIPSAGGRFLATLHGNELHLWDMQLHPPASTVQRIAPALEDLEHAVLSDDGSVLIAASSQAIHSLRLATSDSELVPIRLTTLERPLTHLAIDAKASRIAIAAEQEEVRIYSLDPQELVRAAIARGPRQSASGEDARTVRLPGTSPSLR